MSATIYEKTLTAGNGKCVILEPGDEFLRKTNLPTNWRKIRIGLILSATTAGDSNTNPATEVLAASTAIKYGMMIGMSNGVGYVGDVGNKFVGVRIGGETNLQLTTGVNGGRYYLGAGNAAVSFTASPYSTISNGASTTRQYLSSTWASAFDMGPSAGGPAAASSCMAGILIELDTSVGANGRLTLGLKSSGSTPIGSDSDVTVTGLCNPTGSFDVNTYGTTSPGWWTMDGATPVECQYLSIRCPLLLNRLRVHNMMIQQIL